MKKLILLLVLFFTIEANYAQVHKDSDWQQEYKNSGVPTYKAPQADSDKIFYWKVGTQIALAIFAVFFLWPVNKEES